MSGCYAVFHKQLGDLVLLEPCLSRLRDHHGAPVRLLTRSGHAPLAELMSGVQFVRGLPLAPAGQLYCFDPLNKSAMRSLFAPVLSRRFVPAERRELRWFHPVLFPRVQTPDLGESYVAEFFWTHAPVPAKAPFRPPRLERPPEAWAPPGRAPGSYLLVNPTAGWRHKSWTADGWSQILKALDEPALLTGAGSDWQVAQCREIAEKAGGQVESIASSTSLREYLWLCANARAVLTVDGAASHLAAAFGVPCLTLFGPTNIRNWHRPAPGHLALQAPTGNDGHCRVRNLDPAAVLEAAQRLLSDDLEPTPITFQKSLRKGALWRRPDGYEPSLDE